MNDFIGKAARKADTLPLAEIVAGMLGGSTLFFCLTIPPRLLGPLLGAAGLPADGLIVRLLFAGVVAGLAALVGWLAISIVARSGGDVVPATPRRRQPVRSAAPSEPAPMTLRRGDAHPDAPPRRPIFAAADLGTPFDEIDTARKPTLNGHDDETAEVAEEASAEEPVVEEAVAEDADIADFVELPPEAEAELAVEAEAEPATESAPESSVEVEPETAADDAPEAEERVPETVGARREDESISALMARFEGGLEKLDGRAPVLPRMKPLGTLKRGDRNPDDALRDALEALQRMAARQR